MKYSYIVFFARQSGMGLEFFSLPIQLDFILRTQEELQWLAEQVSRKHGAVIITGLYPILSGEA